MHINLEPYHSNWPNEFENEKARLTSFLGDKIVCIEHIGSTAIPGIHAKPVIDILIGVRKLEDFNTQDIENIESLGYHYIKEYETELAYRRFFLKNDANKHRSHHVHLVNYCSSWWQRHILFRDYLRKNANAAQQYEAFKMQLAKTINSSVGNDEQRKEFFYKKHIQPCSQLNQEYRRAQKTLGDDFITLGNAYALAKSRFTQAINTQAYFDFNINTPNIILDRLLGYLPQTACFKHYKAMFQEAEFTKCYGITLSDKQLRQILERDANHWDQYRYGAYVWFDKKTNEFVGEGGLNHSVVDGREEIELTYSLSKHYWGCGLAAEIGRFAIDYAFNRLKLHSIVCFTMPSNQQSQRVINKLGFTFEKDFTYQALPHKLFRLYNPSP